jgi:hypothetical protein
VAEAGLRAAKAVRDIAQLNLDFTRVVAPISGQIGRRLVDPGNLVKGDETTLAVLVTRDPIHVYFDVDERAYLRLRKAASERKANAKQAVAIGLSDEEGFPHRGTVDFADNQVDPQTGTLRVRAVLPNKDALLKPGAFVRVRLAVGEPHKAVLVPAEAVMSSGEGKYVFVVNDKDVIEERKVVLGPTHDGLRVVASGLKAEDRVVIERSQGLRPGTTVRPRQAEVPPPKPAKPSDSAEPAAAPATRALAGPGLLVEAVYPGASAAIVADTVRAPIEQQINGVEKLRALRSRCTNDGRYALAVTFDPGADLRMAQVLVHNRVAVAMAQVPAEVQNAGVTVRQGTAGVLLIVNLFSPDGKYDSLYLGNYASIQIKEELAHVSGVAEVSLFGHGDHRVRVWLDPEKVAARSLNAGEVLRLIDKQKEAGKLDPEKLQDLVVKSDGDGRVVHLKDIARVELGASRQQGQASLDGKEVAGLVVYASGEARPQKLRDALRERLEEIRTRMPPGLDLNVTFDFTANRVAPDRPTTPEYVLLDVDLPVGASAERTQEVLRRAEALLRQVPGVQHVLTLSENPFDLFGSGPCLLAQLTPAETRKSGRDEVIGAIRTGLAEVKGMTVRVRDLSGPGRFPRCGYPIDLAVCGPEPELVREWARKLGERLRRDKKLTDVWVNPDSFLRPQRTVDVDHKKAAALGVSLEEVAITLRVFAGSLSVNDFNHFGRAWRVDVQAEAGSGDLWQDATKLKVRNVRGDMVPLSAFVVVRETDGPLALHFLDGRPMVEITANPSAGVSAAEGRKLCEALADEVRKDLRLSADYRLRWLQELQGTK